MKTTVNILAKGVVLAGIAMSASACSVINLSDLGIPNPFASDEDVPPAADPSSAAATFTGPAPTAPAPTMTTGDFGTPGGLAGFATGGSGSFGGTAAGSDPRPTDPTAARAYDLIVSRAQQTCPVAPLIIGFGRVSGGYNANATCPSGGGTAAASGFATPYNTVGFSQ